MSAYTLTFAVLLMFGASLGDRFGRRRLFVLGLGIFTAASAAATLAPGMSELIAARAVQGVGAAIVTPLSLLQGPPDPGHLPPRAMQHHAHRRAALHSPQHRAAPPAPPADDLLPRPLADNVTAVAAAPEVIRWRG